ncbi:PREDICTED: protein GRINL1A [Poecilia mexicana]|uniref:RNA polymerase II subunit M n=1 Tax=Poecilia mexicana TaxID=48701 RepID=A0A3B3XUX4_9TELE|nr:PREDICTED: protein GRINL1A [Poecilia mexicana]
MSSPWTERQGQVGDLRSHSLEELQELLLRQEKILSNKRFLQTLPDNGKKIQDFAEKVRLAIEECSEEKRRQSLMSAARAELQSKYHQAFSYQHHAAPFTPAASRLNEEIKGGAGDGTQDTSLDKQQDQCVSTAETAAVNSDHTKESDLVVALDRVTLFEARPDELNEQLNSKAKDNYFLVKQPAKKPHYMTVLEKTERSAAPKKQKFKPNQLPQRHDGSPSESLSPGRSSGTGSPLSALDRKERDRKHLDDITAAKLPPLHHSPAQLLSLEESAALVREQTKKQQELQAKLAAQKLSEGLKISMGSYTPDGGPMAAYREVHDEGAHLSSEED